MSSPKNVIIRPRRMHMLGCCCGCSVFWGALIVFGLQSMLALHAIFTPYSIWAYGIGLLVSVALLLLYFFEGIPCAWNQRVEFGEQAFRFQDDEHEVEIQYRQIVGVEVEQNIFRGFDGGGSHVPTQKIIFQCSESKPTIVWRCHYFPLRSVLKILAELAKHVEVGQILISRLDDFDNERDLRGAAKNLGEISVDEDKNCFWFKPTNL